MIPRVRMARKRLAIARERSLAAIQQYWITHSLVDLYGDDPQLDKDWRIAKLRTRALRAIERRKDRRA